jgi:hypothetical protein
LVFLFEIGDANKVPLLMKKIIYFHRKKTQVCRPILPVHVVCVLHEQSVSAYYVVSANVLGIGLEPIKLDQGVLTRDEGNPPLDEGPDGV